MHGKRYKKKKPVSVLQGDERFLKKILSRNSSADRSSSARWSTYRCSGQVPFQWETRPGQPRSQSEGEIVSESDDDAVELVVEEVEIVSESDDNYDDEVEVIVEEEEEKEQETSGRGGGGVAVPVRPPPPPVQSRFTIGKASFVRRVRRGMLIGLENRTSFFRKMTWKKKKMGKKEVGDHSGDDGDYRGEIKDAFDTRRDAGFRASSVYTDSSSSTSSASMSWLQNSSGGLKVKKSSARLERLAKIFARRLRAKLPTLPFSH